MLRRVSLVPISLSFICFLAAKDFWIEKNYIDWTQKEAVRILTKSPWASAQAVRIRNDSFVTGPSPAEPQSSCSTCPAEAESMPATLADPQLLDAGEPRQSVSTRKYFIRFRTSTPVRMALARLAILSGAASEEKASEYLENVEFPDQIVVVVEPASGVAPELNAADLGYLKEHTFLLLKKSKRKIALQQYVTPAQFGGTRAFFIFPRRQDEEVLVSLQEEEVRFVCRLNPDIKLERKFKLKKMAFKGRLDV